MLVFNVLTMSNGTKTLSFEDSDGTVEIYIYRDSMKLRIANDKKAYILDIDPTQIEVKPHRLTVGCRLEGLVGTAEFDIYFKAQTREKESELNMFFIELQAAAQDLLQRLGQSSGHPNSQKASQLFRLALRIE